MTTSLLVLAVAAISVTAFGLVTLIRARRMALRSENRFSAIIAATGFGVLIVDDNGVISYANSAAADTLGYPAQYLIGSDQRSLFYGTLESEPQGSQPLQEALRDHVPYFGHDQLVNIHGHLVPVAVSSAPIDNGNVMLFQDRTAEVALEQEREQTFALTSHELRSPLTTIVGFSQRLHRAVRTGRLQVPDNIAEEIELLAREALRTRDIVTVILDTATIERGVEIEPEPVLLERLVREEAERLEREQPAAAFTVRGDEEAIVESDERYVRRIIQNLLDNAVKHGGATEPVEVTVRPQDDGWAIGVRDHGPGIPPERHEQLFERFFREQTGRERPGLGLGLFLARQLAGQMGGRVTVASEVGHGAEFTFWLPERPPEPRVDDVRPRPELRW